ncbi:MAG: hypothetical protein PHC53_04920, partial [Patescibacteria group bacterium]|nr:hypothetical protein [Patescibacteria group bacterium]
PPLQSGDDATVEVGETESGAILLDLSDPDGAALKAAAGESIPAPVLKDHSGQPYDAGITGIQDGLFAEFDKSKEGSAEAGSSASQPMEEVKRMGLIQELGKMGITFRPGEVKISGNTLRHFRDLLKTGRWPWADNHNKLKQKLIIILHSAFPDDIARELPNYDTESVGALADALVRILRARDLKHAANKVKQNMPKFPKVDPPPLPPDSKK